MNEPIIHLAYQITKIVIKIIIAATPPAAAAMIVFTIAPGVVVCPLTFTYVESNAITNRKI